MFVCLFVNASSKQHQVSIVSQVTRLSCDKNTHELKLDTKSISYYYHFLNINMDCTMLKTHQVDFNFSNLPKFQHVKFILIKYYGV